MKIEDNRPVFKGITPYTLTTGLESRVLINKAIFDVTGSDIPWVIMANNNEERRERINRGALSVIMVFVSPLIALPIVNRAAMRYVAKLTPKLVHEQYNAIRLSNEYLLSTGKMKEGLAQLAKELKEKNINLDVAALIEKAGGEEQLRRKLITAKNLVLGFDLLMVAGVFGHIGFYNDWQTKRKTGQSGFSAEFKMADKGVVEKRAKKQEEIKKIKYAGFLTTLALAGIGLPLAVRHSLIKDTGTKFVKYIRNRAEIFDYKDALFMSRWPMAISFVAAHSGVFLASRNKSEMKDNAIRSTTAISIFFLGDLLLASILGQISDKFLGTKVINNDPKNKNFLHGILPPAHRLANLKGANAKTRAFATGIFWFNFVTLSILSGFIAPYIINKIVKKDVDEDAKKDKK